MQSINAASLAPGVSRWLSNSRAPRILHIFDRACNLVNEHREVLSIVTPQIGNGPFNLVVENETLFSNYLNVESPILIQDNQLTLGELTITTSNAQIWNPYRDWKTLHSKRDQIAKHLIHLPITNYIEPSGLFDGQNFQTTQPLISNLCSSLATADLPSALAAATKIAGLGPGLTPAGDDFLIGAIYATWIIHPVNTAGILTKDIAVVSAPLTTSLSAAWLRAAAKGEAGVLWHEFFDALISDDPDTIQSQMTRLLSVGHTSGADALAGFIGTFACHMRNLGFPPYNSDGFQFVPI